MAASSCPSERLEGTADVAVNTPIATILSDGESAADLGKMAAAPAAAPAPAAEAKAEAPQPKGDEKKVQAACDVLNEAQTIVDEWIKRGGLKASLAVQTNEAVVRR